MIKEIRLSWKDFDDLSKYNEYSALILLKERGFPVEGNLSHLTLKPKTGLKYYEFHDPKTGELVVQWEESDENI